MLRVLKLENTRAKVNREALLFVPFFLIPKVKGQCCGVGSDTVRRGRFCQGS
jgi:hypothetical protein